VEAWLANAPLSADELMSQTEADLERQAAARAKLKAKEEDDNQRQKVSLPQAADNSAEGAVSAEAAAEEETRLNAKRIENESLWRSKEMETDKHSPTKIKFTVGYQTTTLSLSNNAATEDDLYEEEISSSGVAFDLKYIFNKNFGLNILLATGSVDSITDLVYGESLPSEGRMSSLVLGASYNWGGYEESTFGEWWVLGIGIGIGSTVSNFYDPLTDKEYTASVRGLNVHLGAEYRTINNLLFGIYGHSISGAGGGTRLDYYRQTDRNVTVSSSLVMFYVGYQS
jgi:hypothetical protein